MKKIVLIGVLVFVATQTLVFAQCGHEPEKAKNEISAGTVDALQQKAQVLGKEKHVGPAMTTATDKLSTSGHRNDSEGTEEIQDMPVPDGVQKNVGSKSFDMRLDDTPRNPVQP